MPEYLTVADLIHFLQEHPLNAKVLYFDGDNGEFHPVRVVGNRRLARDDESGTYPFEVNYSGPNQPEYVVVLKDQ